MYKSMPFREDEIELLSPSRTRMSLLQNSSFEHATTQSLNYEHSLNSFTATRGSINSETNSIAYEPLLTPPRDDAPGHSETSRWGRFSPFTKDGRALLQRRLLSSGPAKSTERPFDDDAGNDSNLVEKRAGWRKGTLVCCFAVVLCIIVELVLLIWAAKTSIGGAGSGILYQGNCNKVKNLSIWLLLPLNIAGTTLIGTANYVMQVMTAPSRDEIDQAHRFARPITVGAMTPRNLGLTNHGKLRQYIWWLLVLSSLPIHLMLNSAVYSSVQASSIGVLVVSNDFETDPIWGNCTAGSQTNPPSYSFACQMVQDFEAGLTKELSKSQCLQQYANGFQANASSVIVVAEAGSSPWYHPPQNLSTIKVSSVYGIACRANSSSDSYSVQYVPVPDSERNLELDYQPEAGIANVTVPFSVYCSNSTTYDSTTGVTTSTFEPGSDTLQPSQYGSGKSLFYAANDSFLGANSVLSLFNATDYRYWATAEITRDYLDQSQGWDPTTWLCPRDDLAGGNSCNPADLLGQASWTITPAAIPVQKCHALPKLEQCTLRYSWRILLITIFCDIVKLTAMILALRLITKPLTTLGDIIASYLHDPDQYTKNLPLIDDRNCCRMVAKVWGEMTATKWKYLSRSDNLFYPHKPYPWRQKDMPVTGTPPSEREINCCDWIDHGGSFWTTSSWALALRHHEWVPRSRRWYEGLTARRWKVFVGLYTPLVVAAILYLVFGLRSLQQRHTPGSWSAGFSGPDPNALWQGGLFSTSNNITWAALLVNLPQMLFSMLYFFFNAMFTIMHTVHEWGDFTKHRKALRVSSPRGQQRSTYWLQLPWSYSLPLIVSSGMIHWLLGRGVYLVKVDVYGPFGERQSSSDFFACGYSPAVILALVVLLGMMGLTLLIVSFRRVESGIPFVRLNSLAISAACHPDPSEKDIALQPLMWGIVGDENGDGTQHCSFSAREVSPLRASEVYI